MEYKYILAVSLLMILTLSTSYLVYDSNIKSGLIKEQKSDLGRAYQQINSLAQELTNAVQNINQLNYSVTKKESEIKSLSKQVTGYEQELEEKEDVIINANEEIEKLEQENIEKEQELNSLVNSLQTIENNKIIQESYHDTLILYENEYVYAVMSPIFAQIADDQEDYSKLGIPFFYFKDDTILTEDEKQILGAYYNLYDYIIIYNATNNVRVIYHEIGHIIYKNFFLSNQNNLNIWEYDYNILKENNLLSTQYAYANEQEGFSEEYAAYKTNSNPNQPIEIKQTIFEPIDSFLRS